MKLSKTHFLAGVCFLVSILGAFAQDNKVQLQGKYKKIAMGASLFKEGLEMLGREQEEYARHLTNFALSQIIAQKGSAESLTEARKYIGLALHLSPRNKQAVIANIQLSKGIFPKNIAKAYEKDILATLLFVRAENLKLADGKANKLLAQAFTQMAADLNPHNEDAIYSAAMYEQDYGKLDWSIFANK